MAAKSPTKKAAAGKKAPAASAATKSSSKAKAAPAKAAPAAPKQTKAASKPAAAKATNGRAAATKNKPAAPAPAKQAGKPAATTTTTSSKTTTKTTSKTTSKTTATTPTPTTNAKHSPDTMATDTQLPKPKFSKDGLGYTKDFDLAFIKTQFDLLQQERIHLTGQAKRLEDEAHQLVEEAEMGDVQFDDEGGEGDTMVVERERDLALSAQARDAVDEIDAAIARILVGTYGYSVMSGRPIPKERLEAIPWSSVLVEEKVGGIGRR